jgi:hypothetical protein
MNCANHPDRERVAFCQNCGKPLCQECTRTVGSAVFCEPCLVTKLAGAGAPPTPGGAYPGAAGDINYAAGAVPPPPVPGEPNPGLAALLGFIPGVGAMYNGQYAKGVVHLVVFAILVSLANENGIFGLFIAGWVCYQIIEAHHTARARRDGSPLPNPFGLNDLGERLGFGKAWPGPSPQANPAAPTDPYAPPASGPTAPPPYAPPASAAWSTPNTPWESYATPPVPPVPPPYGAPAYPFDPALAPTPSRFPAGAIWLIGLGCIFLVANAGMFHGFPIHRLLPFFLIGVGVWIFVHKMTDGGTLADDGTPAYRYRLFCAIRSSIWVILVGVLFLLDSFDILSWSHSWPLFIIAAGLIAIFRRVSYPAPAYPYPAAPYPAAPYATAPYAPPPVTPASAAPDAPDAPIVPPSNHHDQEGS